MKATSGVNGWIHSNRIGMVMLLVVAAFVGFYAWYIVQHSDFTNDDLDNLLLLRRSGFWSFVAVPNDVHFVPLHRVLTWLVYRLAPMNFTLAVAVSTAFHVATITYLYRLLRLLGADNVSWLICAGYAISIVPLFGMIWWAHAEHRFPYVFCAVCSIYHYMVWLRHGGRRHAAICVAAFVIGFGFYEKSVMIPAQMLAVAVLSDPARFRMQWRRGLKLPVALGLLALVYVVVYLMLSKQAYHAGAGPMKALEADFEFIKLLGISVTSVLSYGMQRHQAIGWSWQTGLVAAFWLMLFLFSVVRRRRCLWLWVGLLGILFLDFLPIAVSNRITRFDLAVTHQYRFTFEELFVVAVFLGLILRESLAVRGADGHQGQAKYRAGRVAFGAVFLALYGAGNLISLHHAERHLLSLHVMDMSHDYMHNLRQDLAHLQTKQPRFAHSKLPRYMSMFKFVHGAGPVVTLFNPQARIRQNEDVAQFRVEVDGHVRPVK